MADYLHEQYAQKLTLDVLSARYNISKYHLQRSFQHYFGQSPGEYLTQLRLTRAKELLRSTNLSISEVCYQVGYQDIRTFNRVFKRVAALRPGEFKKLYGTSGGSVR